MTIRFLDIERALVEHYELYSEAADADVPRLELPERVWRHVAPVRVQIEPLGGVETVEIAYRDGLGPRAHGRGSVPGLGADRAQRMPLDEDVGLRLLVMRLLAGGG